MAVTIKKDGRQILTGKHYQQLRERVWLRDKGCCVTCGRHVSLSMWGNDADMHLDHVNGRGMGGGKRNDVDSEVETLCAGCHRKKHNQ